MRRLHLRLESLVLVTFVAGIFPGVKSQSRLARTDHITSKALGRSERGRDKDKAEGSTRRSLVHNEEAFLWVENLDFDWEGYIDGGGERLRDRRLHWGGREDDRHPRGWGQAGGGGLDEEGPLVVTSGRRIDVNVEQEVDWEEVARQRDYLNGLVSDSISRTKEQSCNIAFAKTHKTASTTLAMILVRYAKRHDKKLASFGGNHVSAIPLYEAVQQVEQSGERVDVMHYHYTVSGSYNSGWEHARKQYAKIMREDERISFLTVMRDHRSHFLSYYYYYVQPELHLSVEHFFKFKDQGRKDAQRAFQRLLNPMSFEFGIRNEEQLVRFIKNDLQDFRLVMLTEEFDEGLMVLRRLLGWDMIDMTYASMMRTKQGSIRWDGKELKSAPRFEDLSNTTRQAIEDITNLDKRLYEAAVDLYHARKAVIAHELEAEVQEFRELQETMTEYLEHNTSSLARRWYASGVQPYLGGPPFYAF